MDPRVRIPSNRNFYINALYQSKFHGRVAVLADKLEMMNRHLGRGINFDREKFYEAGGVCVWAHRDQLRQVSGIPYADHPISLAETAVDVLHVADVDEIIAYFLHDVVEDTEIGGNFILRKFGKDPSRLVDTLTKLPQIGKEMSLENINRFVTEFQRDIRSLRMKMVDRGRNLLDIEAKGMESLVRNCREALDFYVPLGRLCGFMKAARQLSDIAFFKLYPERYQEISATITRMMQENAGVIDDLKTKVENKYRENLKKEFDGFNRSDVRRVVSSKTVEVLAKPRTVYEVDQIATLREISDVNQLSDILMMQVIVDDKSDCYKMLSAVHSLGTPIDRYFHDYIEDPKINGYQSLHTAILINGVVIRFQIRTRQMQKVAQEGILCNAYTRSGTFRQPELPWMNADWLKIILQVKDPREKVMLVKSFGQAKHGIIAMESASGCRRHLDVLLPRRITPLEVAFIADPSVGLKITGAIYRERQRNLGEEIFEGIDIMRLQISDEVQYRDYFGLLNNPLARLKLVEHLAAQGEEYSLEFAGRILEAQLAKVFLNFEEIKQAMPAYIKKILEGMVCGTLSGREAAEEIFKKIKTQRGPILSLERLELNGEVPIITDLANTLRMIFPVERSGLEGRRIQFSLPMRSKIQQLQLENFLRRLSLCNEEEPEKRNRVKISSHLRIVPPIIDSLTIDPNSLFYSHAIARDVAEALEGQNGEVFDIFLTNKYLGNEIQGPLMASQYDLINNHINNAGVLFLGGFSEDVETFRNRLTEINSMQGNSLPYIVLFEKVGFGQLGGILGALGQKFTAACGLQITEKEFDPGSLLSMLYNRKVSRLATTE